MQPLGNVEEKGLSLSKIQAIPAQARPAADEYRLYRRMFSCWLFKCETSSEILYETGPTQQADQVLQTSRPFKGFEPLYQASTQESVGTSGGLVVHQKVSEVQHIQRPHFVQRKERGKPP